jgi:hypothetical protein
MMLKGNERQFIGKLGFRRFLTSWKWMPLLLFTSFIIYRKMHDQFFSLQQTCIAGCKSSRSTGTNNPSDDKKQYERQQRCIAYCESSSSPSTENNKPSDKIQYEIKEGCIACCKSSHSSSTKQDNNKSSDNEKEYQLAVLSIFKNEADIMQEWLEHNIWQGVEHFYLVDNNSDDNFMTILEPYIDRGLITLHHSPQRHAQVALMESMLKERVRSEAEWVLSIDLDEFVWARPKGTGGSSGVAIAANNDNSGVGVFNIASLGAAR